MESIFVLVWMYILWKVVNGIIIGLSFGFRLFGHSND
jgi:carbon starvation protein CstA